MFEMIFESLENTGDIVKTWLGPVLFIMVNSPEHVKIVLNAKECIDKPYFLKLSYLNKGTLFGKPDLWLAHRKILNPYFGTQPVRDFIPIFNAKTKTLIRVLKRHESGNEFNIFHYFIALTIENIITVMELDVNIMDTKPDFRDKFVDAFET
jgi:cytochrome P450